MILDPDAATLSAPKRAGPLVTFKADEARFSALPSYIFGMHDVGAEPHMLAAEKPGWVVVSVRIKPPDHDGDFASLTDQGLGVIVRLNNGYLGTGSIPNSTQYDRFALHCAEFVAGSRGARVWIIGNEPNSALERPGNDGTDNSGEVITPEMYARCFNACRAAIRGIAGHENDWVIPAAIAPFNTHTNYPRNASGDWVRYFADLLFQISSQRGGLDGIALHAYTHGIDPALVSGEATAAGHFSGRHWNFRTYRDFLAAVPPTLRGLPIFITEAHAAEPGWTGEAQGWIQAACSEINSWNSKQGNQPIQALCFHRWQARPGEPGVVEIGDKAELVQDFINALQNDYRVCWPGLPPRPDYRAEWIETPLVSEKGVETKDVIAGRVLVRNVGARAWPSAGPMAVKLTYRWVDPNGAEVAQVPPPEDLSFSQNILPGQIASIESMRVRAPARAGSYILRYNLLQGLGDWFSEHDSPPRELSVTVGAPPYAVEWEQVVEVGQNTVGTNAIVIGQVRVKNNGSLAWLRDDANPVRLGYRWYDFQGVEMPVVSYPGDFEMDADTPPGSTASFEDVVLRAPPREGTCTLVWDLMHEGVTWFSAKGADICSQGVKVTTPLPDFDAKWVDVFDIPKELEPNESASGSICVQNTGIQNWNTGGANPVKLHSQWYDRLGNQVQVDSGSSEFPLPSDVPAGGSATFDQVQIRAPFTQGKYTHVFDLVKEGVTFFSAAGASPHDSPVEVKTTAPANLLEWVEPFPAPVGAVVTKDTIRGCVVIRNVGASVWTSGGDQQVKLGCRWLGAAAQDKPPDTQLFSLAQDVAPRDSYSFDEIGLKAPDEPGEYCLKFDLFREGDGWFSDAGSPPSEVPVAVRPPPPEWGAELLYHNTPISLAAGQQTSVTLQLRNSGRRTWDGDGSNRVRAAYTWINSIGEPEPADPLHRVAITQDTPPGREARVETQLLAPVTPGKYSLRWDLAGDDLHSLEEGSKPLALLSVDVTPEPSLMNLWRGEASHNGGAAHYAIDGDIATFWSSQANQIPGMWFRVGFGTPRLLDGIAIRSPGNGFPKGYQLRISDGANWRTVCEVPGENSTDIVASFAPQQVLLAQVDLVAPSDEAWAIGEVQIHPASRWQATASLNNDAAQNAVDNDSDTAWAAGTLQTQGMWFQIDLGRLETVTGLSLLPPEDEVPLGYCVSIWNEPLGRWQKLTERRDNRAPVDVSFAPVQTQYLQIQLFQEASKPWAIREARVRKAMTAWVGPSSR